MLFTIFSKTRPRRSLTNRLSLINRYLKHMKKDWLNLNDMKYTLALKRMAKIISWTSIMMRRK
jgi:hypothetical protein